MLSEMSDTETPNQGRIHQRLAQVWDKYALIVVGNIVFFALLYWFSYRPHNEFQRASEFLTMAQAQESEGKLETAEVLLAKLIADYPHTAAADAARKRLPKVLQLRREEEHRSLVVTTPAELDVSKVLDGPPAWFLAKLLANHYHAIGDQQRPRYLAALDTYLRVAFARGEVGLDEVRSDPGFAEKALQQRYVALKAGCTLTGDWVYDDVKIRNDNLFTWHNVVVEIQVSQGDRSETASVRIERLAPSDQLKVAELRVSDDGGEVRCGARIKSDEGQLEFEHRL